MDSVNTVTLYAVIVALCCIALASITMWSRRELRMRIIALCIAIVMTPVVWFAFSEFPGTPASLAAEQFREQYRCSTVTPIEIRERVGMLMLVKKEGERVPKYVFVSWNMRLAKSLQKSMRVAKVNGKGSIIYGASSCGSDEEGNGKGKGKGKKRTPPPKLPGSSGQEEDTPDDFNFYADPVPPNPEKNYGPLFEGPIVIPERK